MLGMEAPHRHDLAWLCRNLERRTISLICNQPFHIWDCGYVMRVTHHCTLTALLPKRSQGKLTKSWVFNHFNKAFSVLRLFTWRSLITGDGNMCDPTMAPMQGIQAPSTLTSSKNREGAGGGGGVWRKTTEQHKMASKSRMLSFHVDRFLFSSLWSLNLPSKANHYCVCTGIAVVPPSGVPL